VFVDLGIRRKFALITGASRGLGKSIAMCLAQEGVSTLLVSRNQADLDLLVRQLPLASGEVAHHYLVEDLSSDQGAYRLLSFLSEKNLSPDIVVHNVGGNLNVTDPFCSLSEWQSVMQINVEVPVVLNRVLIPAMQKKKWGRVCHVSSISGLENQGPPSYCAAKAALVAYTRSLGRYVAKDGVTVTSILPGAVYTEGGYWDLASKSRPQHVEKYLTERMAIQRFGTPDEIGQVVAFLCSNHSSFCVGSAFLVDGGQGKVFFNQGSS
jgi:3-oxoacyl-[acyl-carrier protein] reductase